MAVPRHARSRAPRVPTSPRRKGRGCRSGRTTTRITSGTCGVRSSSRRSGGDSSHPTPWSAPSSFATARVVGEGWHEGPGTPHAEVLRARRGRRPGARGATVVLHARALRPRRPHAAVHAAPSSTPASRAWSSRPRDPNPVVDGRGFARLRAAGIEVRDRGPGGGRPAAERGVRAPRRDGPAVRHAEDRAASLDGKTAAADGTSRWITGEAARADVQRPPRLRPTRSSSERAP